MISNGIDITKIERFKNLKNNTNFIKKVFLKDEMKYITEHNKIEQTMAGIYAAKEAFLKAIKKGINDYALTDIEIKHDEGGAPYIVLHNSLKSIFFKSISISISHDGDYAIASCIIQL